MESVAEVVPGIYNYCDRWCRTCPFTARCRLYRNVLSVPITPRMVAAMRRANTALRTMDRLLDEQVRRQRGPDQRDRARRSPAGVRPGEALVKAASGYARFVYEWFEALPRRLRALPATATATEADPASPVHVVAYHHVIISMKLARAVEGLEAGLLEAGDVQNDANGSAKVALLSMERSAQAWLALKAIKGVGPGAAAGADARLSWLTGATERLFPDARRFLRPGFDAAVVAVPPSARAH